MMYAPASAVSKRNEATLSRLSKMIGETAPTGPLKVATSGLTPAGAGLSTPGIAPPDQLAPLLHNPSPPAPVQVWLAAMTVVAIVADAIAAITCRRRACGFIVRFSSDTMITLQIRTSACARYGQLTSRNFERSVL